MSKLVFKAPGKDEPGFLRRTRTALGFQEKLSVTGATLETLDAMIAFIMDYIQEPKDRKEAYEIMLDLTEEQFNDMFDEITGGDANPTLPKESETIMPSSEKESLEVAEKPVTGELS